MSGRGAYVQRLQGRGAYYNAKKFFRPLKAFGRVVLPKGTLKAVGGLIGSVGGAGAARIGRGIGSRISKAIGVGDYTMGGNHNQIPALESTRAKSLVVRHREYLGNVITGPTSEFTIQEYDLNPGLTGTFPWLSQIATGFEEYEFKGLIWEFKSTSADALNSTNTALGSVIMATEYDSSRPAFQNQQQMANHEFANSCKQSECMLHAVECKRSVTVLAGHRYVRTGAVPSGDDERFYDHGKFQIATVGQQAANVVIGELWCSYEVEFFKPQLISGLGLQLQTDHYESIGGCDANHMFGSTSQMATGSNLGCLIGSVAAGHTGEISTDNAIAFPLSVSEGLYMIQIVWRGSTGLSDMQMPTSTPKNCVYQGIWGFHSADEIVNAGTGQKGPVMIYNAVVKVTASPAYITWEDGVWNGPDGATCDCIVNQFNGNLGANPVS